MILNAHPMRFSRPPYGTLTTECAPSSGDTGSGCWATGPVRLLEGRKIGFFCSSRCPGSIVLKAFDTITLVRDRGWIIVGGFHSVMEWECLRILLRGRQPVIWVPARSIDGMRLKPELRPAYQSDRLLVLSPFSSGHGRMTKTLAEQRNRFVAALSDPVFVPHAAPGGKTAGLVDELLAQGKRVWTIDDPANASLIAAGAVPFHGTNVVETPGTDADRAIPNQKWGDDFHGA